LDPEDRKLLLDIHGTVGGLKPLMERMDARQDSLDERQRKSEIVAAEQGVKVDRLQSDVDGAWKKIKSLDDRQRIRSAAHPESSNGTWLAILEFLASAPKWAHALVTVGSVATTVGVVLWRHWPR
jgi:Flp pilus assembly CpaF family ATPase